MPLAQASALAELHRVLLADRSGLWPAIAGGCHPARDTGTAIEAAGFEIERCDRFPFSPIAIEPSVPHILGVARAAVVRR